MTSAALGVFREFPVDCLLVAPKGQKPPPTDRRIEAHLTGHPIPDREGMVASERVIERLRTMGADDLLLVLVSGGASALLPSPVDSIELDDKVDITRQLLRSRASIHEINTVRRHLSKLKGGRMVERCPASTVLALMISDVPGNQLHDIGSGLTVEDPTTYHDAVEVMKRNRVWKTAPRRIRSFLLSGLHGRVPETPKPGDFENKRVHNIVIADNSKACAASDLKLRSARLNSRVLTSSAESTASHMGEYLAALARETADRRKAGERRAEAVIIGGETTVLVTGHGKGGRNQHAVLSAVPSIAGLKGTVVGAFGTDGIDGNSSAAGAIADGTTLFRSIRRKLDPHDFLERNDSSSFFERIDDALITGATGTNVGDVYLVISLG